MKSTQHHTTCLVSYIIIILHFYSFFLLVLYHFVSSFPCSYSISPHAFLSLLTLVSYSIIMSSPPHHILYSYFISASSWILSFLLLTSSLSSCSTLSALFLFLSVSPHTLFHYMAYFLISLRPISYFLLFFIAFYLSILNF